ncbi:MAG: HAD family phosphatase [Candidatus Moraniibacteriota bacterium]
MTAKKTKKQQKIAIFDIDGTIFRKNLHFELINELSWLKVFPNEVRKKLSEVYSGWLEHQGTYEDYRQALVKLYSEHIAGVSEKDVLKAAQIAVPFQAKRTYIFAEKLIKELRSKDYHIIAVSGSPLEIVEEYNSHYLKFDYVFGSVYAKDAAGKYTGEAEFEPSKNKGEVVKQYLYEHELSLDESYGVGDTESDGSFLRMVTYPIAFNPNENLKKMAEKEKWRIVVEKKDVVYEINREQGKG